MALKWFVDQTSPGGRPRPVGAWDTSAEADERRSEMAELLPDESFGAPYRAEEINHRANFPVVRMVVSKLDGSEERHWSDGLVEPV